MRQFTTGATRDSDDDKYDYEGFLSPLVLKRFAQYMHKHRLQADGKLRTSDNWQRGIEKDAYIKSASRHYMDWRLHHDKLSYAANEPIEEALCALLFNTMGYLFELLRPPYQTSVSPSTDFIAQGPQTQAPADAQSSVASQPSNHLHSK